MSASNWIHKAPSGCLILDGKKFGWMKHLGLLGLSLSSHLLWNRIRHTSLTNFGLPMWVARGVFECLRTAVLVHSVQYDSWEHIFHAIALSLLVSLQPLYLQDLFRVRLRFSTSTMHTIGPILTWSGQFATWVLILFWSVLSLALYNNTRLESHSIPDWGAHSRCRHPIRFWAAMSAWRCWGYWVRLGSYSAAGPAYNHWRRTSISRVCIGGNVKCMTQ